MIRHQIKIVRVNTYHRRCAFGRGIGRGKGLRFTREGMSKHRMRVMAHAVNARVEAGRGFIRAGAEGYCYYEHIKGEKNQ